MIYAHRHRKLPRPQQEKKPLPPPLGIALLFLLALSLFAASPLPAATIIATSAGKEGPPADGLASSTLLAALGADLVLLPVALTADNQPVVYSSLTLEDGTDAATVFPERKRSDGSHYLIDLTLDEVRRLRLRPQPGRGTAGLGDGIASLREHLALLRGLERLLGRASGIVVEPRSPWFHRQEGRELSDIILATLKEFGYAYPQDNVYLQCYDPEELQKLHRQGLAEGGLKLPLVQMVGTGDDGETMVSGANGALTPYNYDWLYTNVGLRVVASYAMALAVPVEKVHDPSGRAMPLPPGYVEEAHRLGLLVLAKAGDGQGDAPLEALVAGVLGTGGVDGLYSDEFLAVQRTLHKLATSPEGAEQGQAEKEASTLPEPGQPPEESSLSGDPQPPAEQVPHAPDTPAAASDLPPFFRNLDLSRPDSSRPAKGTSASD